MNTTPARPKICPAGPILLSGNALHGDGNQHPYWPSAALLLSEPTNQDRARWAKNALAVFTAETFSGDHPDTMHRDDVECAIGDLICDLLHYAEQKCYDPQTILEQGDAHFKTEALLDE